MAYKENKTLLQIKLKDFNRDKQPLNKIYLTKTGNKIEIEIDRISIFLSKKTARQLAKCINKLSNQC